MGYAITAVILADVGVVFFCIFYFTRAGKAMDDRWMEQRQAFEGARVELGRLVQEAERRSREFQSTLERREKTLRDLLYRLSEQEERVRQAGTSGATEVRDDAGVRDRVGRLAASGNGPLEIARDLKLEPAQVRLIMDMYGPGGGGQQVASR